MVSFEDWLVVKLPPPLKLVPADNVIVALFGFDPLLTVCQVLSPLRNLLLVAPLPNLATLIVPEPMFEAFKAVKPDPFPLMLPAVSVPLTTTLCPPDPA
jgi:hypothetical protein